MRELNYTAVPPNLDTMWGCLKKSPQLFQTLNCSPRTQEGRRFREVP